MGPEAAEQLPEIEPCPICESDDVRLLSSADVEGHPNENGTRWWVGHLCVDRKDVMTKLYITRAKAIRAWNRRYLMIYGPDESGEQGKPKL
jgi:hypothetical protein